MDEVRYVYSMGAHSAIKVLMSEKMPYWLGVNNLVNKGTEMNAVIATRTVEVRYQAESLPI
jgi:hypothetical protein